MKPQEIYIATFSAYDGEELYTENWVCYERDDAEHYYKEWISDIYEQHHNTEGMTDEQVLENILKFRADHEEEVFGDGAKFRWTHLNNTYYIKLTKDEVA